MKSLILGLGLVGSLVAHAGAPALINAGTPDAAILVSDPVRERVLPIQTEYLGCLGTADSVYFEDASIDCRPGARARVYAQWRQAQTRALHPAGLTFVGHIEATQDR